MMCAALCARRSAHMYAARSEHSRSGRLKAAFVYVYEFFITAGIALTKAQEPSPFHEAAFFVAHHFFTAYTPLP